MIATYPVKINPPVMSIYCQRIKSNALVRENDNQPHHHRDTVLIITLKSSPTKEHPAKKRGITL